MNYKCDVIVLTWNQREIIKEFVESFLDSTLVPARLIIIDNGSSDGTEDYLKTLKDTPRCQFRIVVNEKNRKYLGGMNQGIALTDAPYVCLANNDLTFTPGWLQEIISTFEKNERVGLLNPNSNNLGTHPLRGTSLSNFAKDLKDKYRGVFVEMPFCIGFCMVVKREVMDKIGGLSEDVHPMFFEDTDYSMKALSAGYFIGMAKASYVWHQEHGAFDQLSEKAEEYFKTAGELFHKKWGKILRIAWIVNDYKELSNNLDKGIKLARQGNFVWFLVRGLTEERSIIFKKHNLIEHSGVKFVRFRNFFDLVWQILKKKKRYSLLISKDNFIQRMFSKLDYKVLGGQDKSPVNINTF